MRKRIDGIIFEKMLKNGLASLCLKEKELNDMNVFPVADGDTGTNMLHTLENGLKSAKDIKHLGDYLKALSTGMLFGARGNSGVILSQLFKGIYLELVHCSIANPNELRNAFIRAYKQAYSAVIKPAEGTILTVSREGIENIRKDKLQYIEDLFRLYIAEMYKSLNNTPLLLPELKEAGVLDSGAYGYIIIIEGMSNYLFGEKVEYDVSSLIQKNEKTDQSYFGVNSDFEEGYCMEFLLQLMTSKGYDKTFNLESFKELLKQYGTSIVCFMEDTIVKVHIHTLLPAPIITLAQNFGEFISFKLENMQMQHNEYEIVKKPVQLASIAVVEGDGIEQLYKDLGCSCIIKTKDTMNTSTEEFANAIRKFNAKDIVIFPNDSNILKACNQAIDLLESKNVTIIPTTSLIQGYFALSMDNDSDPSNHNRIDNMLQGKDIAKTISVSKAVKDYNSDNFNCTTGQYISVIDGSLSKANDDMMVCLFDTIDNLSDFEEKSAMIVLCGKDISEELQEKIQDSLFDKYPNIETSVLRGDQRLSSLLIGIV